MSVFMKSFPPLNWTITRTGSFAPAAAVIDLSSLTCSRGSPAALAGAPSGELVFARGCDRTEHLPDPLAAGLAFVIVAEAKIAAPLRDLPQHLTRVLPDFEAQEGQAFVDEAGRGQRLNAPQFLDELARTGLRNVQFGNREI